MFVLNLFLLTVQKDIKVRARMALLHTAVTINLVTDDFVDSVVVLGSSQGVVFFSWTVLFISPKLGGSVNLSS